MENFTFDRLRGILNQMGVRVIEECGLTALVFRDDALPNSLGSFSCRATAKLSSVPKLSE